MLFKKFKPSARARAYVHHYQLFETNQAFFSCDFYPSGYDYITILLKGQAKLYSSINPDFTQKCQAGSALYCSQLKNEKFHFEYYDFPRVFGIAFYPGVLYHQHRTQGRDFLNHPVNVHEVFDDEFQKIKNIILAHGDMNSLIRALDNFICKKFSDIALTSDPVYQAIQQIFAHHGIVSMQWLNEMLGMSERNFRKRFNEQIGLSPKYFAKQQQINHILQLLQKKPDMNWTELAISCGYYDQSHFIREFKNFTGDSPVRFFSQKLPVAGYFTQDLD